MSSGGGGSTTTTQTQSGPPPQVMQAYEGLVNAASGVASQPLTQYTGEMVAGFTPQQQAGFQTIDNAQGIGFPYINAAAQQYGQATAPLWEGLPQFDTSGLASIGRRGLDDALATAENLWPSVQPWEAAGGQYATQAGDTAGRLPGVVTDDISAANRNADLASVYAGNLLPWVSPYRDIGANQAGAVGNLAGQIPSNLTPYQYQGALAADIGANNAGAAAGAVGNVAGGLQGGAQPYQGFGLGSANAMGGIAGNLQGGVSPYQAAAARGIRLPGYNTLDTYLSPYTKNVTNALQDLFNQQNAEQFQQIRGNAATQGAYGGDREAVAEAITARQQQLGEAPALSQALQSGFAQAQNELNTQQNLQLQRQQAERQLSLGAGQLGLGAGTAAGQLYGQAGQLGLGAGQLGLGAGTAAGQLGIGAGQLGLSGQQLAAQTQLQAGQLGLGGYQAAGQLGIGAGQLGLGAGQQTLAAGQAGIQGMLGASQQRLASGQENLAANQAALQGYLGAGQLSTGLGQLTLGAGTAGMQGQLAAGQGGFGEFNTQQAQKLAADQANRWLASQAGFGMSSLGNQALSQALTGANAQIGAGALQQQLAQEQLNIPYQQFLQAQAYPYQQLSFLSPIVEGTGSLSGGKGSTTYPGPSALSQIGGLGAAATGLSGLFGSGGGGGLQGTSGGNSGGVFGDQTGSAFSGEDFGGGFAKQGGRIGYARGGTTPDVPGVGNGVPILDLSYIPTETDKPVGSSLGIGIGAGGSQTTSGGGGGGGGLLGGIGQAVGAVKTAVDVGSAIGIGDVLGGLFFLKDGGRAGFALGGDTSDPTQVDQTQSDPTKLNTSRWSLPKVPKISLDDIIPLKGNAGPAIKGKGPPDLQAMPQQMPGQPQDSGLKGIGDLGKSLKGMNLFGSSDDSSDSADKGYAGGGVPLSAAINFGGGSPGQSMQVDELRRLPLERLYEMSVRFPQNTPQGQMVARVLNEKRMTPGEGTAPTGAPAQTGASPGGGMGMGGGYGAASAGGMGGQPQDYGGTSHLAHGGDVDEEPGFVTEDELDPHPVVDHSGDSVVIRYPSEGKTLDLGLPSIKDERRHYAGGGAAPWLAGVDPAFTASGAAKIVPGQNVGFDRNYYLDQNPDVKASGMDPMTHYNDFGWHEGRNPSQQFDTNYYLQHNTDVADAGVNPLEHYMQFGRNEVGRSPSADLPGASLNFPGRAVSPNGVGVPMLATNAGAPSERIMQTAGSQTLAPGGGIGNWLQAMPQRTQFGNGPGGSTVFPSATAYTPGMSGVINGLTKGKGTIPPEFGGALPGSKPAASATQSQDDINNAIFQQFLGAFGTADSGGNRRGGRIGYAEGGAPDVDMGSNPNWELQYNNFAGIRRVGAKPGQGGFTAYATPEEGVGAIAGQLDRYAQGKVTGKPINTLGAMVRTWAPPNENQTDLLVNRAAQNTGFHPNQPLDIGDPSVKSKLIDAFIRNEQGNRNPVSMDLINRVSGINPPAAMAPAGSDGGQDGPMRRGGRIGYAEGGEMDDPSEAPPPREREPDDTGLSAPMSDREQAARIEPLLRKYRARENVSPATRDTLEAHEKLPPSQAFGPPSRRQPIVPDVDEMTVPPTRMPPDDLHLPDEGGIGNQAVSRRRSIPNLPEEPSPATRSALAEHEDIPIPPPWFSRALPFSALNPQDSGPVVQRPMANDVSGVTEMANPETVLPPVGLGGPDAPPPPPAAPGIGTPATAEGAPGLGQPAQSYRNATRLADIVGPDLDLPKPFQSLTTAAGPTPPAAAAPPPPNVTRVTSPAKAIQSPEPAKKPAGNADLLGPPVKPLPSDVVAGNIVWRDGKAIGPVDKSATPAAAAPSGAITPLSTDVVIGDKVWRDGKPVGPAAPKAATPAAGSTSPPPVTRVTSPPQVTGTAPTSGSTVEFGGAVPAVVHPAQGYYQGEAGKFTGGNPGNWMGVGDSLAVGYIKNGGLGGKAVDLKNQPGAADADAAGGRSPQEVLAAIKAHPERYAGKNVLLSTGVSNDPSQANLVPQQIKALQDAHAAKIRVLGVGNREGDEGGQHYNLAPYNAQLEQYAKEPATAAAPATGELERAYPNDPRQGQGAGAVPPPAGSNPPGQGSGTGTPETRGIPQMMRPIADALTNSPEAKQAGLTKANMAGILGHLPVESRGGDPTAIARGDQKDGGDSRGIFQWDPNRWANGVRWAQQNGINDFETNGAAQARFAIYEGLSGQDAGAARALAEMKAAGNDPVKSAIAWNHFERPQGYQSSHPEYGLGSDQRQYNAERIFGALNGGTPFSLGMAPGRSRGMPQDDGDGAGSGGSGGGPRQPGPGQPEQVTAGKDGKPVVTAAGKPVVDDFKSQLLSAAKDGHEKTRLQKWMDSPSFLLFMIGAGMLASRSPFPGVALGEGLLAAGKSAQSIRSDQNREQLTEARVNQISNTALHQHELTGVRLQALAQKNAHELQVLQQQAAALQYKKDSGDQSFALKQQIADSQDTLRQVRADKLRSDMEVAQHRLAAGELGNPTYVQGMVDASDGQKKDGLLYPAKIPDASKPYGGGTFLPGVGGTKPGPDKSFEHDATVAKMIKAEKDSILKNNFGMNDAVAEETARRTVAARQKAQQQGTAPAGTTPAGQPAAAPGAPAAPLIAAPSWAKPDSDVVKDATGKPLFQKPDGKWYYADEKPYAP